MAAVLAALAMPACSDRPGAGGPAAPGAAVTTGMTKTQVLETWGRPSLKVRRPAGERWSYWVRDDRNRVVGRAYVVFDWEERVAEVVTHGGGWPDRQPDPLTITRAARPSGVGGAALWPADLEENA